MRITRRMIALIAECARAALALTLARIAIARRPVKDLFDPMPSEAAPTPALVPAQREAALLVARAVSVMARVMPLRCNCLVRVVAARQLLRRRGLASQATIGVTKEGDRLLAHAWLKTGGATVVGGDVSDFVPLLDI